MDKRIADVEFTVFDTETTGLDPATGDRIVEIAAVRLKARQRLQEFQSLVNPQRPISEAAFRVNRISAEMLKDAPLMRDVLPEFLRFAEGSCLCSYNAAFDWGFLNNEAVLCANAGLEGMLVVDILKMARRLLPGLERYALWFVAEKLGLKMQQEHRAMSDVNLTIEAFYRLNDILATKGIEDFHNFLGLFGLSSRFLDSLTDQKLAQIQRAMDQNLKLRIKYLSSSSAAVSEREVLPKEVRREGSRLYLIGYCCLKREERSFRVDGILHLEVI